jgi:hypothetical protein
LDELLGFTIVKDEFDKQLQVHSGRQYLAVPVIKKLEVQIDSHPVCTVNGAFEEISSGLKMGW